MISVQQQQQNQNLEPITYISQICQSSSLKLNTDLLLGSQKNQLKIMLTCIQGKGYAVGIPAQQIEQNIYLACDAGYPSGTSKGRTSEIFAMFSYDISKQRYDLQWSGAIITGIDGGLINFRLVKPVQNLTFTDNLNFEEVYQPLDWNATKYYNFTFLVQQQLVD